MLRLSDERMVKKKLAVRKIGGHIPKIIQEDHVTTTRTEDEENVTL